MLRPQHTKRATSCTIWLNICIFGSEDEIRLFGGDFYETYEQQIKACQEEIDKLSTTVGLYSEQKNAIADLQDVLLNKLGWFIDEDEDKALRDKLAAITGDTEDISSFICDVKDIIFSLNRRILTNLVLNYYVLEYDHHLR